MDVAIFHATAGYGHKKVADVIADAFRKTDSGSFKVSCEDSLDYTPSFFRKAYPEIYYRSVKWTPGIWGFCYEGLDRSGPYACLKPFRELGNEWVGKSLLRKMQDEKPDVIIVTHFFSAELFARAKRKGRLNSKLITVITDFYPHTFWVNSKTDFYWVMSEEGAEDLKKRGVSSENIRVGGIPVDEAFHPSDARQALRKQYGLEPDLFTLLITSGSFGLGSQISLLQEIDKRFHDKMQCLVVCGHNQKAHQSLRKLSLRLPFKSFGFVDFMADLMKVSDLLVAKPGGSTTSESLALTLPMVVLDPIPGQETRNRKLLKERDASFYMKTDQDLIKILEQIFDHKDLLNQKKKNINSLRMPNAARDLVKFVQELS